MLNNTMQPLSDFSKIECPFVRKIYPVNKEHFKKYGSQLKLRAPEVYLVADQINPGYEWVFEDPDTIAVAKLDGTNVKLKTENGRLIALQNRKNVLDPLQILKGKSFIIEGIFQSIQKGYIEDNKEQVGEVIGPKLQGNPYQLDSHIWYPFEKAVKHLRYKSFHNHERTFSNFSAWFKDHLKSLHHSKRVGHENAIFAEEITNSFSEVLKVTKAFQVDFNTIVGGLLQVIETIRADPEKREAWKLIGDNFCKTKIDSRKKKSKTNIKLEKKYV